MNIPILSPWALVLEFLWGTHLRLALLGHGVCVYAMVWILLNLMLISLESGRVPHHLGAFLNEQRHSTCRNTWGHSWHLVCSSRDGKYPVLYKIVLGTE